MMSQSFAGTAVEALGVFVGWKREGWCSGMYCMHRPDNTSAIVGGKFYYYASGVVASCAHFALELVPVLHRILHHKVRWTAPACEMKHGRRCTSDQKLF